jgi:hypothetical protein
MLHPQNCKLQNEAAKLTSKQSMALRAYGTAGTESDLLETTSAEEEQAGSSQFGESENEGRYSVDFPDSTRGTALVSPPDLGTLSPLESTPGLRFDLPDFSITQFLSPSLQVGKRSANRGRGLRAGEFGRKSTLPKGLSSPSTLLGGEPDSDVPQSSLPLSETSLPTVDSSLPTSVDQQ